MVKVAKAAPARNAKIVAVTDANNAAATPAGNKKLSHEESEEVEKVMRRGNITQFKKLLKTKLNGNALMKCSCLDQALGQKQGSRWPLLLAACGLGNAVFIELLLKSGADPNACLPSGCNALHVLLHSMDFSGAERLNVVKMLVRAGFNKYNQVMVARQAGRDEQCFLPLSALLAAVEGIVASRLQSASLGHQRSAAAASAPASSSSSSSTGVSTMDRSLLEQHIKEVMEEQREPEILELLVTSGGLHVENPMHAAVLYYDMAQQLTKYRRLESYLPLMVKHGLQLGSVDMWTLVLHLLHSHSGTDKEMVARLQAFLNAGMDPNQPIKAGERQTIPIRLCIARPCLVKALLDAGLDPNQVVEEPGGVRVLHYAATLRSNTYAVEVCELLLAAGADPNAHTTVFNPATGSLPLIMACSAGNLEVAAFLAKHTDKALVQEERERLERCRALQAELLPVVQAEIAEREQQRAKEMAVKREAWEAEQRQLREQAEQQEQQQGQGPEQQQAEASDAASWQPQNADQAAVSSSEQQQQQQEKEKEEKEAQATATPSGPLSRELSAVSSPASAGSSPCRGGQEETGEAPASVAADEAASADGAAASSAAADAVAGSAATSSSSSSGEEAVLRQAVREILFEHRRVLDLDEVFATAANEPPVKAPMAHFGTLAARGAPGAVGGVGPSGSGLTSSSSASDDIGSVFVDKYGGSLHGKGGGPEVSKYPPGFGPGAAGGASSGSGSSGMGRAALEDMLGVGSAGVAVMRKVNGELLAAAAPPARGAASAEEYAAQLIDSLGL